jgi:hypothetical protein
VFVVTTTTSIRQIEPAYRGPPHGWDKVLRWTAFAGVGALLLTVIASGTNAEWSIGSPAPNASGFFNLRVVPEKHPTPDVRVYCAGVSSFSAALPDPLLIAIEVNTAPNAAAHRAALQFYNDLVGGGATSGDLAAVQAAYACPTGR